MTKTVALIALAVLAAGCTTFDLGTRFTKPDASVSRASLDEWECFRDVKDPETVDLVVGGPVDAGRIIVERLERMRATVGCMRGRGYEPTGAAGPLTSLAMPPAAR